MSIVFRKNTTKIYIIISITEVRIIKKPKFSAEKRPIYLRVFPLTWEVYSRNVIRLAREEIRVPTPPILTPTRSSLQFSVNSERRIAFAQRA